MSCRQAALLIVCTVLQGIIGLIAATIGWHVVFVHSTVLQSFGGGLAIVGGSGFAACALWPFSRRWGGGP